MLTSITNVIFVAVACVLNISIVKKLDLLARKASSGAQGKKYVPTLSGHDELARLDRSLSDLFQIARKAKANKQLLDERINYELLIPLAQVLAAMKLTQKPEKLAANDGIEDMALSGLIDEIDGMLKTIRTYTGERLAKGSGNIEEYEWS